MPFDKTIQCPTVAADLMVRHPQRTSIRATAVVGRYRSFSRHGAACVFIGSGFPTSTNTNSEKSDSLSLG